MSRPLLWLPVVPIRKDGAIEKTSKGSTFVPVSWYFCTSKLSAEGQEIERKSHDYTDGSKLATACVMQERRVRGQRWGRVSG